MLLHRFSFFALFESVAVNACAEASALTLPQARQALPTGPHSKSEERGHTLA